MRDNDENLSWCRPEVYLNGRVILAINEGQVDGIVIDGKYLDAIPATLRKVAKLVNADYSMYTSGQSDTQIIRDAEHDELPCRLCPWFDVCQAMDEEMGEE